MQVNMRLHDRDATSRSFLEWIGKILYDEILYESIDLHDSVANVTAGVFE